MGSRITYKLTVRVTFFCLAWLLMFASCSTTKNIPEGQYLYKKAIINVDTKALDADEFSTFLVQNPSEHVVGMWIYNWAGSDSTKWINRWLHRIGNKPVVYSRNLAEQSASEMELELNNKGYLNAYVIVSDTTKKKKATATFDIVSNNPHRIRNYKIELDNKRADSLVSGWKSRNRSKLHEGAIFDMTALEDERATLSSYLRNRGYYSAAVPFFHYYADTALRSNQVDLLLSLRDSTEIRPYYIRNVSIVSGHDSFGLSSFTVEDTATVNGLTILYDNTRFLRPAMLSYNTFVRPGQLYNENRTDRTYEALSSLGVIQRATITYDEVTVNDTAMLDCNIYLASGNLHGIQVGVDGTNKAGDLGIAGNISYSHYNFFNGAEVFNVKLRGDYEFMTGNTDTISNGRSYYALGVETSLKFPQVHLPFLKSRLRNFSNINTQYTIAFDMQRRPEYQRNFFNLSWKFSWSNRARTLSQSLGILNINYVTMPWTSDRFQAYLDQSVNSLTRFSYEDIFTAGITYNLILNSPSRRARRSSYTFRFGFESSGNLLNGLFSLSNAEKSANGQYTIWGNPFAQYVKGDVDYSRVSRFSRKNSLATRIGVGVALPYGNSTILPFEKRYYAGGPNNVRGWKTRYLGPGAYSGSGSDIAIHTGDINLIMNVEFRHKLFDYLEVATFVDAGNIWTIRDYSNQPDGLFRFSDFYKEIAIGAGIGLRIDLSFLIIRLDAGKRVYDPAKPVGSDRWTFFSGGLKPNSAFYFAIGYPF